MTPARGLPVCASFVYSIQPLGALTNACAMSIARMEEIFAEFRAEIRLGQEDAAAKELKRARYEKPYEYKRKGNQ